MLLARLTAEPFVHWILQTWSGFWMEVVVPAFLPLFIVPSRKVARAPRTQPTTSMPTARPATAPPSSLSESDEFESDESVLLLSGEIMAETMPGVPDGHEGNLAAGA